MFVTHGKPNNKLYPILPSMARKHHPQLVGQSMGLTTNLSGNLREGYEWFIEKRGEREKNLRKEPFALIYIHIMTNTGILTNIVYICNNKNNDSNS